jgi:hypothetical protein
MNAPSPERDDVDRRAGPALGPRGLAALGLAVATALALVAGGVGAVTGTPAQAASSAPPTASVDAGADVGVAPQMDGDGSSAAAGDGDDAFVDCDNGTSRSMLACGYNPGPTAVELDSQIAGRLATVQAVSLAEGGFVVIHELSFVDGDVTDSIVGLSPYLDPGLHKNVRVPLADLGTEPATYVAVVYTDDGDRLFEFVDSGGAVDRPYTVRYSAETGNVTDEAGDVIGDTATLRPSPTVADAPAMDPDMDGRYEDVDGNGEFTVLDVVTLLDVVRADGVEGAATVFDFNDDGRFTILDVVALLRTL